MQIQINSAKNMFLYKFLLACFTFSSFLIISGANSRRYEKRWIQPTGFGGAEVKREISGDQQAGGIQGDNGIFPKYPGDEEVEFETEVEQPGQEQDKDKLEQFPKEEGSVNPEFPVVDQESVSGGQSQETTGQETGSSETFGQEQEGDKKLDEVGGGQVSEQDGIVVDATTEGYKPHKPWYKKVHGFFKNQYDYLKQRLGRGDYYVNT